MKATQKTKKNVVALGAAAVTLLSAMGVSSPSEADVAALTDIMSEHGHIIVHPASIIDGPFVA